MHKTHSHPIPVPLAASARRATMSPLNAELVELESWLETTLHLLGADGVLYARCVLSILRQTIDNDRVGSRRQSPDVLQNVTVVKSLGRDAVLSFPSGVMMGVVSPLDADLVSSEQGQQAYGARRRALLECLRTVELDERKLRALTDEILERYAKVVSQCGALSANTSQNDSIDSGVCPSPVESDQNYDEAFPPLSDVENDDDDRVWTARGRKTSTTVKRTTAPVPIPSTSGASVDSKCATSATTTKSTTTITPSTSIGNELGTSLRMSIGNKLSAPFTREWATRSAELFSGGGCGRSRHASMSKGDGTSLAHNVAVSSSVPHRLLQQQQQHGVHHHVHQQQSLPHFVVARAPSNTAGGAKVFSGASKLEYSYSGLPGGRRSAVMLGGGDVSSSFPTVDDSPMAASSLGAMLSSYDAPPRFILHIINEHQRDSTASRQPTTVQAQTTVKPQYHHPQPPVYFDAPMPDLVSLPGFGFDPWAEQQQDNQHHRLLQPNSQLDRDDDTSAPLLTLGSAAMEEDFFCVPRMQDMMNACHQPLPEPQPTAATFVDSVLQSDAGVKIPVSPDTHFVPIRSESMEEAYVPANVRVYDDDDDNEQLPYSIDFYGAERYFVLRNPADVAPAEPTKRSLPIKFKALRPEKHCQTGSAAASADKSAEWVGTDEWRSSIVEAVIASSSDDATPTSMAGSSVYVSEGDNTVALPDAWANTVWEPRLSIASSTEEERWPNEPGFRAVLQGDQQRHRTSAQQQYNNNDNNNNAGDGVMNNSTTGGCEIQHLHRKPQPTPPDDDDDDVLLRYVGNINLLSPLDSPFVAAV